MLLLGSSSGFQTPQMKPELLCQREIPQNTTGKVKTKIKKYPSLRGFHKIFQYKSSETVHF